MSSSTYEFDANEILTEMTVAYVVGWAHGCGFKSAGVGLYIWVFGELGYVKVHSYSLGEGVGRPSNLFNST